MSLTRPPFDPELAVTLEAIGDRLPPTVTPQMIQPMRDAPPPVTIERLLMGRPITRTDHTIPGFQDGQIPVTVFARDGHTDGGPAILRLHGGVLTYGGDVGARAGFSLIPFNFWVTPALTHPW